MASLPQRCTDVTHSELDAHPASADNQSVKLTLSHLLLSAALFPLLLAGCEPRSASPHQLTALHEQNTLLRDEIARMETLIRQAGDDVPGLTEQIAQREQEVKAASEEYCRLTKLETQLKLRTLHLQERLDAFQHTFNQLQKNLANTTQR